MTRSPGSTKTRHARSSALLAPYVTSTFSGRAAIPSPATKRQISSRRSSSPISGPYCMASSRSGPTASAASRTTSGSSGGYAAPLFRAIVPGTWSNTDRPRGADRRANRNSVIAGPIDRIARARRHARRSGRPSIRNRAGDRSGPTAAAGPGRSAGRIPHRGAAVPSAGRRMGWSFRIRPGATVNRRVGRPCASGCRRSGTRPCSRPFGPDMRPVPDGHRPASPFAKNSLK